MPLVHQKLAAYKAPPNNKIELLYFLGVGWATEHFPARAG